MRFVLCLLLFTSIAARAADGDGAAVTPEVRAQLQADPDAAFAWLDQGMGKCAVDDAGGKAIFAALVAPLTAATKQSTDREETQIHIDYGTLDDNVEAQAALSVHRLIKVRCIQSLFVGKFGGDTTFAQNAKNPDFTEAVRRLSGWGPELNLDRSGYCPLKPVVTRRTCIHDVVDRFQNDADLGWAMELLAQDLHAELFQRGTMTLQKLFALEEQSIPFPVPPLKSVSN